MKNSGLLALIGGALALAGLVLAGWLCGASVTASDGVLRITDPEREARATAIAQQALDAAALRAVQLREAQAKADTEERAAPAALAGKVTIYLGGSIAVVVLLVGLAFAFVAYVHKKAGTIYPDERGQFPIIVKAGLGWVAYQDPNRGLGPATVVRTPTLFDALAGVAVSTVQALKAGTRPELPTAQPEPAFALPGSEETVARITSQAQAAQLVIASGPTRAEDARSKARAVAGRVLAGELPGGAEGLLPLASARMPRVEVIDDPQEVTAFEQRMLAAGGEWR